MFMDTQTFCRECSSSSLTNENIHGAVNLWFSDRETALERYGHISNWDTTCITNMRSLFKNRTDFNYEDILRWNLENVIDLTDTLYGVDSFTELLTSQTVRDASCCVISTFKCVCFLQKQNNIMKPILHIVATNGEINKLKFLLGDSRTDVNIIDEVSFFILFQILNIVTTH